MPKVKTVGLQGWLRLCGVHARLMHDEGIVCERYVDRPAQWALGEIDTGAKRVVSSIATELASDFLLVVTFSRPPNNKSSTPCLRKVW